MAEAPSTKIFACPSTCFFLFPPGHSWYLSEMRENYYEILGIEENASIQEIKQAYKKLAKRFHPDVSSDDPSAGERFKEIALAYEILCDPHKRGAYAFASAHDHIPDEYLKEYYLQMMMQSASRRGRWGCPFRSR
jgi:curved DNA-binding protein CbpA